MIDVHSKDIIKEMYPEFLTSEQAAEYLGVTKQALLRWRNMGKVNYHRFGERIIRYTIKDLDALYKRYEPKKV